MRSPSSSSSIWVENSSSHPNSSPSSLSNLQAAAAVAEPSHTINSKKWLVIIP